jgi:hypothetical protein
MEAYFLERFLFVFGLIIFAFCLVFFVVNFLSDFDGMMFILTLFGMLNASIAMGVSKIISVIKGKK